MSQKVYEDGRIIWTNRVFGPKYARQREEHAVARARVLAVLCAAVPVTQLARKAGVSRVTVYKILKELAVEQRIKAVQECE